MKNANRLIYLFILGVATLGFVGIIIYSCLKNDFLWIWMSASLVVSLASFLIGGLIGFLFGIPKFNTKYTPSEEPEYLANTSLEQISDWLTKIIVGVGLTQLIVIPKNLMNLSEYIVAGIVSKHSCQKSPDWYLPLYNAGIVCKHSYLPEDTTFILSLILLFFILGFFFAFFYARLELNNKFVKSSALIKAQDDLITETEKFSSLNEIVSLTANDLRNVDVIKLKIEDFKIKLTSFQKDVLRQLLYSSDKIYRQPTIPFRQNEFEEFVELISLKILQRTHPLLKSYKLTDNYSQLTMNDIQ
ncbi:MAG: hypothetical protein M0P47_12515 [Bacteroidales bacterium]|nr:hypothetical protein [Bacteroidales bacterium]